MTGSMSEDKPVTWAGLFGAAPDMRSWNDDVPYNRALLVTTLIEHQRASISHCGCGWSELGLSHAEHIADAYEDAA